MIYSMKYSDKLRYGNYLDEVIFYPDFIDVDHMINILNKASLHNNRRVIIDLDPPRDWIDTKKLDMISKALAVIGHSKDVFWFARYANLKEIDDNYDTYFHGYKFIYKNIVQDWETLNAYKKDQPGGMRIGGQLCFELLKVAEALGDAEIEVRVLANQTTGLREETDSLVQAWFRPEAIASLDGYIDVCELAELQGKNESVIVRSYVLDHKWFGPYNEIVAGLDNDLDGRYTIPRFDEARLDCGRRCLKDQRCQSCYVISNLGTSFEAKGVYVNTH